MRFSVGSEPQDCQTFTEALGREAGSVLIDRALDETLPERLSFSKGDRWILDSWPKQYYPGVRAGFRFPNFARACAAKDQYVSTEDYVEGLQFDADGKILRFSWLLHHALAFGAPRIGDLAPADALETAEKIETIAILTSTPNHSNYYHWWLETLASVNYFANILNLKHPIFMPRPRHQLKSWQIDSIKIITDNDLVYPAEQTRVVRFDQALWCDGLDISCAPSSIHRGLADRVQARVVDIGGDPTGIFIKRATNRGFINEEEVEAVLASIGVETCVLDNLDQIQEIQLFRRARIVVGASGAGLANSVFCRPGAAILEIMPSVDVRDFYWMMAAKLGCRYGTVVATSIGSDINARLYIDPDHLRRAVGSILGIVDA